jgi:putative flippase GtrA
MLAYETNNNAINLPGKFIRFLGVSGIGWLVDFSIYCTFVFVFHLPVFRANILSAIPAVTFVFFVSVRKVFARKKSKFPLWLKYASYICYTIILLLLVSIIGQWGYGIIMHYDLFIIFRPIAAILVKCAITGITMMCNFFMMKFIVEAI